MGRSEVVVRVRGDTERVSWWDCHRESQLAKGAASGKDLVRTLLCTGLFLTVELLFSHTGVGCQEHRCSLPAVLVVVDRSCLVTF